MDTEGPGISGTAPRITARDIGAVRAGRTKVVWKPNPGTQELLVSCPIEDVGFGGARGGGKSWGLLGDWLIHAWRYGKDAAGILFRRTYDELDEIQKIARLIFPLTGATFYTQSAMYGSRIWVWPSGATFKLRYLKRDEDAEHYQGHSYTWLGIDEMGNFADPTPINLLRATLRSGAGVPCVFRASFNPGGVGHNWIKAQYVTPAPPLTPFYDSEMETERVFIPSLLDDNPALLENDPDYWKRVKAAAAGNEALLKAWRWGIWDIVAGGMFDDVYLESRNVIKTSWRQFIPPEWYIDRAFDYGSAKPFSVGWFAESDGTRAGNGLYYPPGTIFHFFELYGWNGKPNVGCKMTARQIAAEIVKIEADFPFPVQAGPADSRIFQAERDGGTIADDMREEGVEWIEGGVNLPGTRVPGWARMREYLVAARNGDKERPGLYVFDNCTHWKRTVPILPRDKKKPEDVDSKSEDHIGDMTRYRVMSVHSEGALI